MCSVRRTGLLSPPGRGPREVTPSHGRGQGPSGAGGFNRPRKPGQRNEDTPQAAAEPGRPSHLWAQHGPRSGAHCSRTLCKLLRNPDPPVPAAPGAAQTPLANTLVLHAEPNAARPSTAGTTQKN